MTSAEKYRQLEISPSVQVARWIFNNRLNKATKIALREVVEDIKTGKTPSKDEKKYYENGVLDWFKPSEIGEGKYLISAKDKLSQLAVDTRQATIYKPGTLLVIGIGAGIGRLAITKDVASSNQQITGLAFNKLVLPEYAYYYFLAFREFFYTDISKSTIPIINQKKITSIPFILCGVDEQKSIIEFLSAIESIRLPQDVDGLSHFTSDAALLEAAKRIFAIHFASATLVTEFDKQDLHLTQLRQALLREAMQGQLLPQDPTDEPAAVLLQQLQAAAKPGKKGRGQAGALFAEEAEAVEGLFAIPASWAWCTLGEITNTESGITLGKTHKYETNAYPYLRVANVQRGYLDLTEMKKLAVTESEFKKTLLEPNDLLVVEGNGSFKEIGRCAIWHGEIENCIHQNHIIRVRPSKSVAPELILYFLNSSFGITQMKELAITTTGLYTLSISKIKNIRIPLPPLAEQHRIVTKLAQLLQHCDALEQRIRESCRLAEQLLATALREVLAPPAGTALAAAPTLETAAPEPTAPRRRGRPVRPAAAPLFE